ncbi:molybdate ABC transporter substrate-binding protein [Nesterenkonia salmonea]|uniref:Molybdate ABC transporter substrate-binding protein n=1 Tax=Nesterenkonia salmonea TaxID=1804987 RepID=A0A5R9B9I4_9MICC|nr:molybdate ABC transporter substrate-binding protein [Nesterenkonia salmonea]TLP93336.1 molybdate ABC transporter substrate-binding protein [Nesterenkonia salmonea]
MKGRSPLLISAAAVSAALLGGCAEQDNTLTVFAAASLHEPFQQIGEGFSEETGIEVAFNTAGSSGLVDQLENGAPGDVLATADETSMNRAERAGLLAKAPVVFAQNYMVIVTPDGNPAGIGDIADLAELTTVSLCAPQVPCGAAASRLLADGGVELSPAAEELSVTDVLGRVRAGEADAGLVYTTSAQQAGDDVEVITIDGAVADPNSYPATVLEAARYPEEAQLFVEYLLSAEAQQVLADAGFSRVEGL